MKQLEKESIKWNNEENGRIISIQVDLINPKYLSFAKNKNQTNMGSTYIERLNHFKAFGNTEHSYISNYIKED